MDKFSTLKFNEIIEFGDKWQEILKVGDFSKGRAGVKFTKGNLKKIVEHFEDNTINSGMTTEEGFSELPVNIDHLNGGAERDAAGWIFALKVDKNEKGGVSLFAKIRFTDLGREKVASERFRGFSVEVHTKDMPFLNVETGEQIPFVLVGLALTNEPFIPGMKPAELRAKGKEILHNFTSTNMETVKAMLSSLAGKDKVSRAELELLNTAVVKLNDDEQEEVKEEAEAVKTKVEETEAAEEAEEKEEAKEEEAAAEEADKAKEEAAELSKAKLQKDGQIEKLSKELSAVHSEIDTLKAERREEQTRISVEALAEEGKIVGKEIVDKTTDMLLSKNENDAKEMIDFLSSQPARVDFSEIGSGSTEKVKASKKIEEATKASKEAGESAHELADRLSEIEDE